MTHYYLLFRCLQSVVDNCGHLFNDCVDQDLLNLIFQALDHTNRFVRETGYYVCSSLVSIGVKDKGWCMYKMYFTIDNHFISNFSYKFTLWVWFIWKKDFHEFCVNLTDKVKDKTESLPKTLLININIFVLNYRIHIICHFLNIQC